MMYCFTDKSVEGWNLMCSCGFDWQTVPVIRMHWIQCLIFVRIHIVNVFNLRHTYATDTTRGVDWRSDDLLPDLLPKENCIVDEAVVVITFWYEFHWPSSWRSDAWAWPKLDLQAAPLTVGLVQPPHIPTRVGYAVICKSKDRSNNGAPRSC